MEKLDGKSLEKAVLLIEKHVLNNIAKNDIAEVKIETNKIFVIDGVRNEVDVYVEIDLKIGTNLIYIFECKNWKKNKKVSKNDIIIFSSKIDVINAQKGYFVAIEYSKDALNQAIQDKRIQILNLDKENSRIFEKDYFIQFESSYIDNIEIECQIKSKPNFQENDINNLRIKSKNFQLQTIGSYIKEIITKGETEYKLKTKGDNKEFKISESEKLTTLELSKSRWSFYLEVLNPVVNDQEFEAIRFKLTVDYVWERPAILFDYNVVDKGHYIKIRLRGLFKNDYSTMELTKNVKDNTIQIHNLEIEK